MYHCIFLCNVVASSVDISSNTNIAVEGSILELTCNASGIPKPVITWKKVGDEAVLSGSSSQITVTLTRPETPGNTVRYQCIAHNGVGSPATASITVTVLCKCYIYILIVRIKTVEMSSRRCFRCCSCCCLLLLLLLMLLLLLSLLFLLLLAIFILKVSKHLLCWIR